MVIHRKDTGAYRWSGTWARWEIREMEYVINCLHQGTRTEEEVWSRFLEIMRREKRR